MKHIPVLHRKVLEILLPKKGEIVVDVTIGLGGHAVLFLQAIGSSGTLIGLDADSGNLKIAERTIGAKNVALHHANFSEVSSLGLPPCDILFADLGLSSPHLDDPNRGFSFRGDGPLDCRYDQTKGVSAAELISQRSEEDIASIFHKYGEVKRSRTLASAVKSKSPQTTVELVSVIEEVFDWRAKKVLPQIFQALRIAVNDEIVSLASILEYGPTLLKSGGRMGIISYHSLEDRLVKETFRSLSTAEKHPATGEDLSPAPFDLLIPKPISPDTEEIEENPRSRSARFRAIIRR